MILLVSKEAEANETRSLPPTAESIRAVLGLLPSQTPPALVRSVVKLYINIGYNNIAYLFAKLKIMFLEMFRMQYQDAKYY